MSSCEQCGHAFKAMARYCAQCGAPAAGTRACARCASVHSDDDRYCATCGLALGAASAAPPETSSTTDAATPPARDTRLLWLIGGMFAGALLSAGGALSWWLIGHAN